MSIVLRSMAITCLLAALPFANIASATEIRRIGQTEATSDCIGDPKTTLCAVETFLACFGRRDRSLCRSVGVRTEVSLPERAVDIEYEVIDSLVLRPEDIPETLKGFDWARPGLTKMMVRDRYCEPARSGCASSGWLLTSLTLEKVGDKWRIITWSGVDTP